MSGKLEFTAELQPPWRAVHGDSVVSIVTTPGGRPVAVTASKPYWKRHDDTDVAIANIMAAAPELYEALRRLLGNTDPGNASEHDEGCMCVIHEARAALAKAVAP